MISDIRNTFLRRATLIFTVASIIVCLGPAYLILRGTNNVLRWVEDEFDVDLRAAWRGTK